MDNYVYKVRSVDAGSFVGAEIINPDGMVVGRVVRIAPCDGGKNAYDVQLVIFSHVPVSKKNMDLLKLELIDSEARELVFDAFHQACYIDGEYDHMCLSTYEGIQEQLIAWGMLEAEKCRRP